MKRKLTLTIDRSTFDKAEKYATTNNILISELIENFLASLELKSSLQITPTVAELSGIISSREGIEQEYKEFLQQKYS